jgi:hypothetical protein
VNDSDIIVGEMNRNKPTTTHIFEWNLCIQKYGFQFLYYRCNLKKHQSSEYVRLVFERRERERERERMRIRIRMRYNVLAASGKKTKK